ncbi:MAG TPA: cyclase family protein [Verrucomicrobiae bacterium]|jgi:kynurenine formamidase|nr:cyclase family protein [Verrucomicrobiae bacterium]
MQLIDLSHPLAQGQASFPNDPKMAILPHGTIATHDYNITQLLMGTHQGTHLDAMFHFFDDGRTLDQMPLEWFYGPAIVLHIPKNPNGEISVNDLRPHEKSLTAGTRVIVNTGWHKHFGKPDYFNDFPSFSLDAARYLATRKIRLLGMDMPTPGKQWLELHHILLAKNVEIVVVEALANLDALPDEFIFAGFPLNIKGRDGSPIRAVAICA